MGQGIDRPMTMWQEMFLPSEIGRNLEHVRYTTPTGEERPLVTEVEVVNRAVGRPGVLEAAPPQWPRCLAVGLLLGLLFAFLAWKAGRSSPTSRAWTRAFYLGQSLLGLVFGVAGSLLFFLTFITDHDYTWHNSNLIFVNPLLLAAVPLGFAALTKEAPRRWLRRLWAYVAAGALLTCAIKLLPGYGQQNQATVALVLPWALVLGVTLTLREAKRL
jgi:hypothetical protein